MFEYTQTQFTSSRALKFRVNTSRLRGANERAGCGVERAHVNGGQAGGVGAVITGLTPHYALNDKLKRISIIPPSTIGVIFRTGLHTTNWKHLGCLYPIATTC